MQELPTDEELSSDSYEESEDSYSDEDLDRTYYSSDPLSEATDGIDSMYGSQANDETDLEDRSGELEGEGQPRSSPEEVMATMGTIISMFLRMQDSEDSEDESYQESAELNRQSLVQELLSTIPIEQIFNSFLAQINMAQVRAFVYNFFYCLLRWKSVVSVAALLVIMRVKRQQVSPLPGPSLEVDYPPPRHTLRLILDSSLIAGSGMVTALIQLFSQMPPLLGANTIPARQLAEMFIRPRCWQRNALHSQPPRGLRFTPGFWFTLCHFFGIRANPEEDVFPGPHERRYLELHVVGDEDVVLREALQDDLQRYRQCGLHDGLQDTSQDAQDNDVQEALLGDQEAVTFRPQDLLDPEVLAFLNNRLLYILGADGRLTLISRDEVAQALTRFLIMASRIRPPPPPSNTLSSSDDELD
ncbi:Retrotransposon-like protein 1 [Microtus ochrogaster]|uniref:Retrotransposon-like protein 1 n=1 Tax=Microtus ochrogaster TaxID=79684 RepID=A0A8J6G788_MICOH|nr:Retrotransposon-like protein 1 [Microtus ochrogaster]